MRSMVLDAKPKRRAMTWIKGPPRPLQSLSRARMRLSSNPSSVAALLTGRVLIIWTPFLHLLTTSLLYSLAFFFFFKTAAQDRFSRWRIFIIIIIIILWVGWRSWEEKKKNKKITVQEHLDREMKNCETWGKIKAKKLEGKWGEIVWEGGEERMQSSTPWSRNPKPRQHRRSGTPRHSPLPSPTQTAFSHHPALPPCNIKYAFLMHLVRVSERRFASCGTNGCNRCTDRTVHVCLAAQKKQKVNMQDLFRNWSTFKDRTKRIAD